MSNPARPGGRWFSCVLAAVPAADDFFNGNAYPTIAANHRLDISAPCIHAMLRWVNTAMSFAMFLAVFAVFAVKLRCVLLCDSVVQFRDGNGSRIQHRLRCSPEAT